MSTNESIGGYLGIALAFYVVCWRIGFKVAGIPLALLWPAWVLATAMVFMEDLLERRL